MGSILILHFNITNGGILDIILTMCYWKTNGSKWGETNQICIGKGMPHSQHVGQICRLVRLELLLLSPFHSTPQNDVFTFTVSNKVKLELRTGS